VQVVFALQLRRFSSRRRLLSWIDISPFPFSSPLSPSASESFTFHKSNLLDSSTVDAAIASCLAKYGRVDILANVAGVMTGFESADTLK
jgi:NAD(P)-dependent dehydrogenase (short-subunit alcohol dehydrogenase family)